MTLLDDVLDEVSAEARAHKGEQFLIDVRKILEPYIEDAENWRQFHPGLIQSHNLAGVIFKENEKLTGKLIQLSHDMDSAIKILDRSQGENYFHEDGRYNIFKLVAELREALGVSVE